MNQLLNFIGVMLSIVGALSLVWGWTKLADYFGWGRSRKDTDQRLVRALYREGMHHAEFAVNAEMNHIAGPPGERSQKFHASFARLQRRKVLEVRDKYVYRGPNWKDTQ